MRKKLLYTLVVLAQGFVSLVGLIASLAVGASDTLGDALESLAEDLERNPYS
jgi:hypothetical protein